MFKNAKTPLTKSCDGAEWLRHAADEAITAVSNLSQVQPQAAPQPPTIINVSITYAPVTIINNDNRQVHISHQKAARRLTAVCSPSRIRLTGGGNMAETERRLAAGDQFYNAADDGWMGVG